MKIIHLRNYIFKNNDLILDAKGGLTVCYIQHPHYIEWNYAICSEEDVFSRKRGRHIAEGRFLSRRYKNLKAEASFEDFLNGLSCLDKNTIQKYFPILENNDYF